MSTVDFDFSPTEIENSTREIITLMLLKMMKIMEKDRKGTEDRFVHIQESIDKRMEKFISKLKVLTRMETVMERPLLALTRIRRQV